MQTLDKIFKKKRNKFPLISLLKTPAGKKIKSCFQFSDFWVHKQWHTLHYPESRALGSDLQALILIGNIISKLVTKKTEVGKLGKPLSS